MAYIHGAGNIIPGLENALNGKAAGDQMVVDVAPEDAYGPHNEKMIQSVPRDRFKGVADIKPGMQFQANTPQGPRVVTVGGGRREQCPGRRQPPAGRRAAEVRRQDRRRARRLG